MARGWESKAIEDQQAEKEQAAQDAQRVQLSPEVIALRQRIEALHLARSQILAQLERARHESHRQMLNDALQQLEQELAWLSATHAKESNG